VSQLGSGLGPDRSVRPDMLVMHVMFQDISTSRWGYSSTELEASRVRKLPRAPGWPAQRHGCALGLVRRLDADESVAVPTSASGADLCIHSSATPWVERRSALVLVEDLRPMTFHLPFCFSRVWKSV